MALKIHAAHVDVSKELSIQRHLLANSKAAGSSAVLLLLDSFTLEGPNGKHHCFVTEPLGPSVSAILQAPLEFYDPTNPPNRRLATSKTRNLLQNVLVGLEFIHGNGIVHGDLHSGNLLSVVKDITAFSLQDLEQDESNSHLRRLLRIDGKVDLWAPKYLAIPQPLVKNVPCLQSRIRGSKMSTSHRAN